MVCVCVCVCVGALVGAAGWGEPVGNKPVLFSGDALLIRGSGRTDFAGGDAGQSYDSIVQRLFALPDETIVFPGHDYRGKTTTTIGEEKRSNPRVAGKSRQEYAELMAKLFSPANLPEKIQQVLQVNQSGMSPYEEGLVRFPKLQDLNTLPQVDCLEMLRRLSHDETPPTIIDVRPQTEVDSENSMPKGRIPGSRVVLMPELEGWAQEQLKHETSGTAPSASSVIVVCRSGIRSNTAAAILRNAGLKNVSNLKGGMLEWSEHGLPIV